MPKNTAKTAETGTRPPTPDTQNELPLNLNKDSTFRNGVISVETLTRWLEKAGIPQGETLQIAEGWIKVHKINTAETISELTLKELQKTLSMPIGYAKRVMKQIQIDTYHDTDEADIEDSEEADEEEEGREAGSMVKTLAKVMEHNTKAFLKALSKNQDKEEGGTWSLAGVEAPQAGHGLRGPTVTDFESYLTRVETIAAGTKIASVITLMKSRVTAANALGTYDMQAGTLSDKKLMAFILGSTSMELVWNYSSCLLQKLQRLQVASWLYKASTTILSLQIQT